jgi:hypothetical protein
MRRISVVLSVAAVILLGVLAVARSFPTDAQDYGNGFVGSWRVVITEEGDPNPALLTFHADGTLTGAEVPVVSPPPGSPFETLMISGVAGAWAADGQNAAVTFDALAADAGANVVLRGTVRGELQLDASGDSFSGAFTLTRADEAGNPLPGASGTVEGTRIVVEAMGTPEAGTPVA